MDRAKAVELAFNDPNARYVLGLALVRAGQRDERAANLKHPSGSPPSIRRLFRRAEMDSQDELRQLQ